MRSHAIELLSAAACLVVAAVPVLAQPANNSCTGAPTLVTGSATASVSVPLSTVNATHDGADPECTIIFSETDQTSVDVWYKYTASTRGIVRISVEDCPPFDDQTGSNGVDLGVALSATTSCGSSTALACSHGACSETAITLSITSGQVYYIRVATFGITGEWPQEYVTGTLKFTETPAPANDVCSLATPVGPGSYALNNKAAFSNAPYPTCGLGSQGGQRATWYAYTAASTRVAVIDTFGSNSIAVFNSCAANATPITCASNEAGRQWWASFPVTQGQVYLVRVGVESSDDQAFTMRIREFDAVPNDLCSAAQTLLAGTPMTWRNSGVYRAGATAPTLQCSGLYGYASVWYVFTPSQDGIAAFHTNDLDLNTVLEAYSGSCSGPVLGCNDNIGRARDHSNSYLAVRATAHVPIYLRLAINTGTGNNLYDQSGTLGVDLYPRLSNDDQSSPSVISTGTVSYDSRNATDSSGFAAPTCALSSDTHKDLWYSWTPTQSRTAVISTCTLPVNLTDNGVTHLSVYKQSTGQQVACNAQVPYYPDLAQYPELLMDMCGEDHSLVEVDVTANTTYLIRVAGRGESSGPGKLNVLFVPPIGQAVDLISSASTPSGTGTLDTIEGELADSMDVDIYKIQICDHNAFFASTVTPGTSGSLNTALFLFDASGKGVSFSDDTAVDGRSLLTATNVHTNGIYYLAVTTGGRMPVAGGLRMWSPEPFNVERAPDGPGATGVLGGWAGGDGIYNPPDAPYSIDLGGVCFAPACRADFNGDNTVSVSDIFAFLRAWFARTITADMNNSGTIEVADIFAFLRAWFARC